MYKSMSVDVHVWHLGSAAISCLASKMIKVFMGVSLLMLSHWHFNIADDNSKENVRAEEGTNVLKSLKG